MSHSYIETLSGQRFGKYAEYYVKLELTRLGFDIYTPEVDDRGIDLIARKIEGNSVSYLEIQVKATRQGKSALNYVFVKKSQIRLAPNVYVALVAAKGEKLDVFLIPSTVWLTPDDLFISRDYEGKASPPEWEIRFARNRVQRLFENYHLNGETPTLPSPSGEGEASGGATWPN